MPFCPYTEKTLKSNNIPVNKKKKRMDKASQWEKIWSHNMKIYINNIYIIQPQHDQDIKSYKILYIETTSKLTEGYTNKKEM